MYKFEYEYHFLETFRFNFEYKFYYEYDFLETFRFDYEYKFDYEYWKISFEKKLVSLLCRRVS